MLHLGDITKIDWSAVEPVDVVTGGSPCQNFSIAGNRKGLSGNRSGLFMEQIRCIKSLRKKDEECGRTKEECRPRFMLFENVVGLFSVHDGEDFRAILEETARVSGSADTIIPRPPGKWTKSGAILANGWSIAWTVHDAKFFGLPQRRKRVSLVADFGGNTAPQILFESKGLPWSIEQGEEEGKEIARDSGISTENSSRINPSTTLKKITVLENYPNDSRMRVCDDGVFQTLSSRMGTGGNNVPMVLEESNEDIVLCVGNGQTNQGMDDKVGALNCMHDQQAIMIIGNSDKHNHRNIAIRRLTPLETERLQGLPDNWTNIGEWINVTGKRCKSSDGKRYAAIGNSIALPFFQIIANNICAQYDREVTMGSLFDGIGGFSLVFQRAGAKPLWASEIEPFPIAVCKKHFGDEETGEQGDIENYL